MKTLALWIIAICYLAQTVAVYGPDESGGGSIFLATLAISLKRNKNAIRFCGMVYKL